MPLIMPSVSLLHNMGCLLFPRSAHPPSSSLDPVAEAEDKLSLPPFEDRGWQRMEAVTVVLCLGLR